MARKFLDIERVIRQKAPGLGFLPRFVVNYIRRIIHEEEINAIFAEAGEMDAKGFLKYLIGYFETGCEICGEENLPADGRCMFVSNHPLGGMDGIILMDMLCRRYGGVKAVVNDILCEIYPLREVFVPVNKLGRQSREYAEGMDEVMRGGEPVLYFPSGMVSRMDGDGRVADMPWRKSFATRSIESGRGIVPIYFEGKNSMFFYRLSYYRKKLGVRTNIEMLYLPDELFGARGRKFKVRVGERIGVEEMRESGDAAYWAEEARRRVYTMAETE